MIIVISDSSNWFLFMTVNLRQLKKQWRSDRKVNKRACKAIPLQDWTGP
jgi:hypothetical protein